MKYLNILLSIAYDGTNYCGWQRQKNGVTVQECMETTVAGLLKTDKIQLTACSRTDAGVHATDQKACFQTDKLLIPLDKLPQVLNSLLPDDIVVTKAEEKPENFNPRYAAKKKRYSYTILNSRYNNPMYRNFSYHVPYALNLDKMQTACRYFLGTHDFKAFSATGSQNKTSVRTVFDSDITKIDDRIVFTVTGNGFLYNMVRILTGTLLYVGIDKINPDDIPLIIAKKDRTLAGKTVPPQGLNLLKVEF